jgi:virginiamycin B lyase
MLPKTLMLSAAVIVFASLTAGTALNAQGRGRGGGAPVTLPDGAGRPIVEAACTTCHALDLVVNNGHDAAEWRLTIDRMITAGAAVPSEQVPVLADYLIRNFPEKGKPPAVAIAGSSRVTIKEWDVPTKGSRPHDPLAAADGSLWWTGMYANVLGRLDPKTGAMKEFPLKTPGSGPHGLVEDKAGNIWFTANAKGYIGRLNPKTGEITEYKMPDPAARDPHTPIFDQQGMLWFTAQGANMIGRLNPQTGEIKLVTSKTPRSNPYGMVVNSKGVPFLVLFGTNKIASLDPTTMAITEYTLPHAESRPRRIAITDDDVIWYADYSRGYLGRFDTKTGKITEYASPGGPKSQPYGITATNDIVWYSEANTKPNTLVRFDPKTEKFQTWAIPSGGGVVRTMMATKDGNLVMAESAMNKVALVEILK